MKHGLNDSTQGTTMFENRELTTGFTGTVDEKRQSETYDSEVYSEFKAV